MSIHVSPLTPPTFGPPSGATELSSLVRKYLLTVGRRRYPQLDVSEIRQYALLSVYQAIKAYGPENFDLAGFLDRVLQDDLINCAYLLPGTDEAYEFQEGSMSETVVLVKITGDVKPLIRRIFVNMIEEEIRKKSRQHRIISRLSEQGRPVQRRKRADRSADGDIVTLETQSLDAYVDSVEREQSMIDKITANQIKEKAFAKMSRKNVHAVQMILQGDSYDQVAEALNYSDATVRVVFLKFMRLCKEIARSIRKPT